MARCSTIRFCCTAAMQPDASQRRTPLALAGPGDALDLQHGRLRKLDDSTPMSGMFVAVLKRMAFRLIRFADSTGELSELAST